MDPVKILPHRIIRIISLFAILLSAFILVSAIPVFSAQDSAAINRNINTASARPSSSGQLRVSGSQLVDKNGDPVVLRGVSTHGLTWYKEFVNKRLFMEISDSWDCSLIRLPVYSDEYVRSRKSESESIDLVKRGIDAAIDSDMYVIVDWHVLNEQDPNVYINDAVGFFDTFSSEYANVPNVIYEICNEPNGNTTWSDIVKYSKQVIPVIRKHSPNAVILVGTPDYDRNLGVAKWNPLEYDNLMYVLHFYAATHEDDLENELLDALNGGLPVFISECGICEATGDGDIDYDSAVEWFRLLDDHKLSYTVWSLSNKNESSAFFLPDYDPEDPITDDDLTACGMWIRSLIRGEAPEQIEISSKTDPGAGLPAWLRQSVGPRDIKVAKAWRYLSCGALIIIAAGSLIITIVGGYTARHHSTYNDIARNRSKQNTRQLILHHTILIISIFFTLIYLGWRILFSVPVEEGPLPITANILLLIVEVTGFFESLIMYRNLMGLREYSLPVIKDEEFPDVDIFIATYNEPVSLLYKTINGCKHMIYPDSSKVHIWLCDDNRRPEMKKLASDMGVGYFDRPDNKGAKAGNLNNALSRTNSPYIVTFDSDMIPKSDFLLKTIPYFIDAEKKAAAAGNKGCHLGFLQTPQSFYDPDVFQHALYAEKNAPNEQDFFYRTLEVAKTNTNSVIYGGSNTVLSRHALEDIGGFYTETITEDFATGLLIESSGYVSLAIPEPLANGQTTDSFNDHIRQRNRWGRGVINTAKKLKLLRIPGLTPAQRLNYLSSVIYWYSPLKNLIYILSPLLFAVFAIPIFRCGWTDLFIYWLPMFIMQDLCLRALSDNRVSLKWSGIYETSVMPFLLIPVIKETLGISLENFAVTDKFGTRSGNSRDVRLMRPFLILIAFSAAGVIRMLFFAGNMQILNLIVLLFWITRNIYFLIMSVFLADGREYSGENVHVRDAEPVTLETENDNKSTIYEGTTTYLNEHHVKVFPDDETTLKTGDRVTLTVSTDLYTARLKTVVIDIRKMRNDPRCVYSLEILDYGDSRDDYLQIIYDRVPTLPRSLRRDFGILFSLLRNIAHRILRHE